MSSDKDFRVVFEAVCNGWQGDIALDDIDIEPVSCFAGQNPSTPAPPMDCTFETDLCGYDQMKDDNLDWTRHIGSTSSSYTGPSHDHTTGKGYYIYLEASFPQTKGDKARINSPAQNPTTGRCLQFWYHMYGPHVDRLNVYLRDDQLKDSLIFTKYSTQGNQWLRGQKEVTSDTLWSVVFEAVVGTSYYGDIAIDDISLDDKPCVDLSVCDFEIDLCGWTHDSTADYEWQRDFGGTPSTGTGPSKDHSTGTNVGYYVYLETSVPHQQGDKARLLSPVFDDTYGECLHLWYHMYGSDIGQFNVYGYDTVTNVKSKALFSLSGNQGNEWRFTQITFNAPHDYQIIIEGVRGKYWQGDIAIDDVLLTTGACPRAGFCDFERDMCGWTNADSGDQWDWLRTKGGTPSLYTGPSTDHTTNSDSGFYIYFETSLSGMKKNDKAVLRSQHLAITGGSCLSLWYHMYGKGIGTLTVYTEDNKNAKIKQWSLSGDQGNIWLKKQIQLTSTVEYQVLIEATYVNDWRGDIALDDLDLEPTPCVFLPTPAPTTPGPPTHRLLDHLYLVIPHYATPLAVCYHPVLLFPTEPSQYDCDFESGWCVWQHATTGTFKWSRQQGSTWSVDTGPEYDHTTGTSQGYYVYIEASGQTPGAKAHMTSPDMTSATLGKCVRFWYHMFGPNIDTLNVLRRENGKDTVEWTRKGDQGPKWTQGQVFIDGSFAVIFEGVRGSSYKGDIALDDIEVLNGKCPLMMTCDFEHGDCGFAQDKTDNFDWTMGTGATTTPNTGPPYDHTYQSAQGHYMYIDVSGKSNGDMARIRSPEYPATFGTCMKFWYYMVGVDVNALKVYVEVKGNKGSPVWDRYYNAFAYWMVAEVSIQSAYPYRILFEGLAGSGPKGDIAIDDIDLTGTTCSRPGSCDFENDFCLYMNIPGDDMDWLRNKGSTDSYNTGPSIDHTLGTSFGYYVYIETSSPSIKDDFAYLMSETLPRQDMCLSFWYHMKGNHIGTLNVWQQTNILHPLFWTKLWSEDKEQGDVWLHTLVDAPKPSTVYEIVFQGIKGSSYQGDIAIDDIQMYKGLCTPPTPAPPCQFNCKNGKCLTDKTQICNFVDDCGDKSEEANCETTPTINPAPSEDHTISIAVGN
ncbi:MAM and LDL-receptor class A domain-containing protein 1-like [Acanthaster planci]|uniref:MAM and LDL-receptor class A domain-containing protein 1-like n=1 Tax=Acanthaster planci TaxID=133434 RepID=A0A8B7YUM5_ACAPL|nr:MAM and LDL-receptor class A domain-containing protein 1-like [Acanthaster planci]